MVYLIGAGPGNPKLITVRGLECLKQADVVIYDYLVDKSLLGYAKPDAQIIYVGKKAGVHTLEQNEINKLIVQKAKQKKYVVRLKGGDPYMFGRGAEEALTLLNAKIPFEVVPGVPAFLGVSAYAGIPVTHREFTSTVTLITGHEDPTKKASAVDFSKIAPGVGTLVFYMAVKNTPEIVKKLLANGRSPDELCAFVEWGTTPKQRTIVCTLKNAIAEVEKKKVSPPALFIVGKVVQLHKNLNWFEKLPLFGKSVVVTRTREQASELTSLLKEKGAYVFEFPTIKISPVRNFSKLDKAIKKIKKFNWVIFTSRNGVKIFIDRVFRKGKDLRILDGVKICAIGPGTKDEFEKFGIKVDLMPDQYINEGIIKKIKSIENLRGKNILIPRASGARQILVEELNKLGANVLEIIIYNTVPDKTNVLDLKDKIKAGEIDFVSFTSSSTVKNFVQLLGIEFLKRYGKSLKFVSIGPVTSKTAKNLGLNIFGEARQHTIQGLVNTI
ncbi:MAG: uroporphyrinogen-III C-methyltransferase [Candidatus Firestonebacteria bacterium]